MRPSGFCAAHDPGNVTAFREASARGGRGKATAKRVEKLVPATLRPTLDTLLRAVDEVKDGSLTPGQASAMASLAGAAVRVYMVADVEQRLAALEQAQEAQQGGRRA